MVPRSSGRRRRIGPGQPVEGPQLDTISADFADALRANPGPALLESLATFYRKGWVTWSTGLEARAPPKPSPPSASLGRDPGVDHGRESIAADQAKDRGAVLAIHRGLTRTSSTSGCASGVPVRDSSRERSPMLASGESAAIGRDWSDLSPMAAIHSTGSVRRYWPTGTGRHTAPDGEALCSVVTIASYPRRNATTAEIGGWATCTGIRFQAHSSRCCSVPRWPRAADRRRPPSAGPRAGRRRARRRPVGRPRALPALGWVWLVGSTLSLTGAFAATAGLHQIAGELFVDSSTRRAGSSGDPSSGRCSMTSRSATTWPLYDRLITQAPSISSVPMRRRTCLAAMGAAERHGRCVLPHAPAVHALLMTYECQFRSVARPGIRMSSCRTSCSMRRIPENPPQSIVAVTNAGGARSPVASRTSKRIRVC